MKLMFTGTVVILSVFEFRQVAMIGVFFICAEDVSEEPRASCLRNDINLSKM